MIKAKVGDTVNIECYTSMGTGSKLKVTRITIETILNTVRADGFGRYSFFSTIVSDSARERVLWCGERAFSAKDGKALTEPFMYYIESVG